MKALVILALIFLPLVRGEIVHIPSTVSPCGDTPVFCYGEPWQCKGLVDNQGNVIRRFAKSFQILGPFSEGLLAVRTSYDGPVGYIDQEGRWAIKPQFDSASRFSHGLARFCEDRLCGFLNKSGEVVIERQFSRVTDFDSDGFAQYYNRPSRRMGVIDRSGEVVIKPQFVAISPFTDGVAAAVKEGPCWQEVTEFNDTGTPYEILSGTLQQKELFWHEQPNSKLPHCRWILIDTVGERVGDQEYLEVRRFSEGLAAARVESGWGYIDRAGEFVIPPDFPDFGPYWFTMKDPHPFSEGLAAVASADGWMYIDPNGEVALRTPYEFVRDFHDALSRVWGTGEELQFFIDKSGTLAFPQGFNGATNFCHGVAEVSLEAESDGFHYAAFINTQGKVLFSWKWY